MRFAITAFNRKVIDAEEFDVEKNNKLLIICPNKGCSSPLTYVRTVEGQRYFRHPRRKQKELTDPSFQCEQRAKGISRESMKRYNKIVEQTTILQFQKNFYKVIGLLNNWDDKLIDRARIGATNPKFVRLIDMIYKKGEKQKNIIKGYKDNDVFNEAKKKYKELNNFQIYELLKEERRKYGVLQYSVPLTIIDPSISIVADLADRFIRVIEEGEAFKSNADDEYRRSYPAVIEEQIVLMPRVLGMLMHENSTKMRNFLLYIYCLNVHIDCIEKFTKENPFKSYFPSDNTLLENLIGEYFSTIIEREDRPLNIIYAEIMEEIKDGHYKNGAYVIIPEMVSRILCDYEVERYHKAVKEMEEAEDSFTENNNNKFGYIYLAYNESLFKRGIDEEVKIGKTSSIPDRNSSYQTYSSDGFIFEHCWSVNNMSKAEKYLHRKLNRYRIKESGGQEWFSLPVDDARQKIGKLISNYEEEFGYFDEESKTEKGFG